MSRLFLVRHGETDWNVAGRLQGRTDISLNALGRAQASQVARVVTQLAGGDVSHFSFVASPLARTVETMVILRTTLDLPVLDFVREPRLMELSFGRWEGHTWPELRRRYGDDVHARDLDPWTFAPPAGESYAELSRRAAAVIDEQDNDAILVTHGGVIRSLLHVKAGMPQREAALLPIRQGAVYVLTAGGFSVAD